MPEETQQLGNYLILEKIAQGGMAQIFKAKTTDPAGIERLVVIKRILPHISSHPEYVDMLIDEAKTAVHFNHGNIAQVYDLGRVDDDYFIVMEYVDGKTLSQILKFARDRKKKLPFDFIAYALLEICNGLDYIHHKNGTDGNPLGVVHRDISPQNIILSYSGTIKIVDFGIAKSLDKLSQTESGVLKGKYAYMSPEQAGGDKIDKRSDIFSAGILLWELITLERLFKKETNKGTVEAVKKAKFSKASKIRKDTPRELDNIIGKALNKKQGKRYQNASEMALDLRKFLVKYFPNFRPLDAAKILYRFFGPEADEEGLPPDLPELDIQKELPENSHTEKESLGKTEKANGGYKKIFEIAKTPLFLKTFALSLGLIFVIFLGFAGFKKIKSRFFEAVLVVDVSPNDSLVVLNHQELMGSKPYKMTIKPKTIYDLEVSLSGYISSAQKIELARGETRTVSVQLQKKPDSGFLIETTPPKAIIYINDSEWKEKSPTIIKDLEPGQKYTLSAFLPDYEFLKQTFIVKEAEIQKITLILKGLPAILSVSTLPTDAIISVNGVIKGKTPVEDFKIEPGKGFKLKIEKEGYETYEQTYFLKPAEKKSINIELKSVQTEQTE